MATHNRSWLLKQVRGQEVRMPDLRGILEGWPGVYQENVNPNRDILEKLVSEKLEK